MPLFLGFRARYFGVTPAGGRSIGAGGLRPAGIGPVHLAGEFSLLGGGGPIGDRGLTGDRLLTNGDLLRDRLGDLLTSVSDSPSSHSNSDGLLGGSTTGSLVRSLSRGSTLTRASSFLSWASSSLRLRFFSFLDCPATPAAFSFLSFLSFLSLRLFLLSFFTPSAAGVASSVLGFSAAPPAIGAASSVAGFSVVGGAQGGGGSGSFDPTGVVAELPGGGGKVA